MAYRSTLRCLSWWLVAGFAASLEAQVPLSQALGADVPGEQVYYWSAGRRIPLRTLAEWKAVASPDVAKSSRSLASASDVVVVTPDLVLIRRDAAEGFSRSIGSADRVVFASGDTGTVLVDSGRAVVELDAAWSRSRSEAELAGRGIRILEHLFDGWYVVEPAAGARGLSLVEMANRLFEDGMARNSQPDFIYPRTSRVVSCNGCVEDTFYRRQWHLEHSWVAGVSPAADVDAEDAWAITRGDRGIAIAVIDDGVEIAHEDLQGEGKIRAAMDFFDGDDNPSPGPQASHGTACAGVATAVGGNGLGVTGIAPESTLIPIRYHRQALGSNAARAIYYAVRAGADVISSSWGPKDGDVGVPNDTVRHELPDVVRAAFRYATERGRGGKGTLIFWAAGNGNEPVTADGFAASEYVFAIGAINDQARRSLYSDYGPELDFVAPSNGLPPDGARTPGILTLDRTGIAGFSPGDYTDRFGGTSSATALAAGIAALVLAVNPDLTWRQVYEILKQTADKVDRQAGEYRNGFSRYYGWGKINAGKAVGLARDLAQLSGSKIDIPQPSVSSGAPQGGGAQTDHLRLVVRVTNRAGVPIEGASLGILKPDRSLERDMRSDDFLLLGSTDASGLFDSALKHIRVAVGRYLVKVVHPRHKTFAGYAEVRESSQPGIAMLSFKLIAD